jgi:hypothetical protein
MISGRISTAFHVFDVKHKRSNNREKEGVDYFFVRYSICTE